MPRVECENIGQVYSWLDAMVKTKRRYVIYYTRLKELIIQPLTSTAPVTYCYLRRCTEEQALKVQDDYNFPVMRIKNFEWSSENQIVRTLDDIP